MPTALKTGIVQHALDVAGFYLRNATLRHGLPAAPPSIRVGEETAPPTAPAPVAAPYRAAPPSALKTAGLVGLSLLAGGGLAGAILSNLPARVPGGKVVEESAPDLVIQKASEKSSPLQWLEDQGLNVPPALPSQEPQDGD